MNQVVPLAGYDFPPNKACFVCRHIMEGRPVLLFSHDEDGDLQFACGRNDHNEHDWMVVDIEDVLERDADLHALPTVRVGEFAERSGKTDKWIVT